MSSQVEQTQFVFYAHGIEVDAQVRCVENETSQPYQTGKEYTRNDQPPLCLQVDRCF